MHSSCVVEPTLCAQVDPTSHFTWFNVRLSGAVSVGQLLPSSCNSVAAECTGSFPSSLVCLWLRVMLISRFCHPMISAVVDSFTGVQHSSIAQDGCVDRREVCCPVLGQDAHQSDTTPHGDSISMGLLVYNEYANKECVSQCM